MEYVSQGELAEQLGVTVRTLRRWRTEGKVVETRRGTEVIYLHSINTAGARGNGRVLIPVTHEESIGLGQRLLGKVEFIAALGFDPVLRRAEVELFL